MSTALPIILTLISAVLLVKSLGSSGESPAIDAIVMPSENCTTIEVVLKNSPSEEASLSKKKQVVLSKRQGASTESARGAQSIRDPIFIEESEPSQLFR